MSLPHHLGALRVLLVGESWVSSAAHIKGSDVFVQPRYEEGGTELIRGLGAAGISVTRIPAHLANRDFPASIEALDLCDVVVISDVGADSFELTDDCMSGRRSVSRLRILAEWVNRGGALLMIGGYLSFTGIQGRARYGTSALAQTLPVTLSPYDDRVERPDGVEPRVLRPEHLLTAGLPESWPYLLGYNRVRAKEGAETIVAVDDDPLIVVGSHGAGRVAAFTSDCAPHWASQEFLGWDKFPEVFVRLLRWLAADSGTSPNDQQSSSSRSATTPRSSLSSK